MKTILITGGSGLVGRELTKLLTSKGYKVSWLSRASNISSDVPTYFWDYHRNEIDDEALLQADVIVHLAGENIGSGRWSASKKKRIIESRVQTADLLLCTLKKLNKAPEAFISASAVGIYGNSITETLYTENKTLAADDFLADVCRQWENAAHRFSEALKCRTVILRTGMVLSSDSAAFKKLALPVKFCLGAPIGTGKQRVSWIHIRDLCEIYVKAIEDTTQEGVFNAVAPHQIDNRELMSAFSKTLNRPALLPRVPAFLLKLMMGEAAEMVLGGSSVSADKIIESGYRFHFPKVEKAIEECLK